MHTLATDPHSVVMAGDVIDWANLKAGQMRNLIFTVAAVMASIAVLMAWWRTKSWVGTLVAFVLAALVLWGIGHFTVLKDKVGSEIDDTAAPAAVVKVMDAPGPDSGGRLR